MQDKTKKGKMTVEEAGRKGGMRTSREHGSKFYHEIGTKGGQRVKDLVQAGKKAEKTKKASPKKSRGK